MALFGKGLDGVVQRDLEDGISRGWFEGTGVDFKAELRLNTDSDKLEFLADVTSFTNCSGGHFVAGIAEKLDADGRKTGAAGEIVGLGSFDEETERGRISQIIRSGVDPRMSASVRFVDCGGKGKVLLIEIPRRICGLHQIVFKDAGRFYSRNDHGKYRLDVRQIERGFVQGAELWSRVREFRLDRLSHVRLSDATFSLREGLTTVVQLVPLLWFEGIEEYDLTKMPSRLAELAPPRSSSYSGTFNSEGYAIYDGGGDPFSDEHHAFWQVHRSGLVECVISEGKEISGHPAFVPSLSFERGAIEQISDALRFIEKCMLSPPVNVQIALLGARGATLQTGKDFNKRAVAFKRDIVLLPDVTLDDFGQDVSTALKPAFDYLWQCAGYAGSEYYLNGIWNPDRS